MTLTELEATILQLAEDIKQIKGDVCDIKAHAQLATQYTANDLQGMGYSKDEAYAILHSHGYKQGGRLRIKKTQLAEYQGGGN